MVAQLFEHLRTSEETHKQELEVKLAEYKREAAALELVRYFLTCPCWLLLC